jgi:glycosyltransferase involved in cell wall biosynthesis
MTGLSIAHVLSSFDTGGQERVALDLAKAQRAAGHQVCAISLAASREGPLAEAFRQADVRTKTIAKGRGVDPTLSVRIASYLSRWQVNVVHTHNPHALIYGAPAAKLVHAAAVHTKHGRNPDQARRMWLRRTVSRVVDAYVAVTQTLARVALENNECAPARLHVIANGIDAVRFTPNPEARSRTRAELRIPEDAWVVGTVGRLSPEKNQNLLVDAMAPLLDAHRQLVIVGDGPERESLHLRVAATWRTDFAHLVGARKDVENWLAAFDVFALTSHTEGLPLVLLEAMAMRLPVISTAVGGVPDLVEDGVTGFLIQPGDRAALSKQLTWLASRPAAALEVAEVARNAVLERYTTERMARDYEALYEGLVRTQQPSRKFSLLGALGG